MTEQEQQAHLEAARNALLEEQRKRWQMCWMEINAVLEKYRCRLVAVPTLTPDGRIVANISVTDKPS